MSHASYSSEENQHNSQTYSVTKQTEPYVQSHEVIQEIDKHVRQGILAYAEGIGRYTLEIEKLKAKIEGEKQKIKEEEEVLLVLEREVGYDEKLLQRHNDTFMRKVNSLQELNSEYKEMIDAKEYTKLFERKKHELQELEDEINALEMTLLDTELERINLLLKLEPKRNFIAELQCGLKELELEKEHFESTKLHQIPLMLKPQTPNGDEPVDTEVME